MRACINTEITDFYDDVLLYVDNILCTTNKPREVIARIDKLFTMQPGLIAKSDIYLSAKVSKIALPNGVIAWALSASKYAQKACNNVTNYLDHEYDGRTLDQNVRTPFPDGYHPELDIYPELNEEQASFYNSKIGVLRWIVELVRIYIISKVLLLSFHLDLPRAGHIEAVFCTFDYLKTRQNARLVLDPII